MPSFVSAGVAMPYPTRKIADEYGLGGGAGGGGGTNGYGLGADLPAFGIREGRVAIDAPVIPFFGAVGGGFLLSTKMGAWGWIVGGVAGYYLLKLAVIGVKGQNVSQTL